MRPERGSVGASETQALIASVARRTWWRHVAICALCGTAVFAVLTLFAASNGNVAVWRSVASIVGFAVAAATMVRLGRWRSRRAAAAAIERVRPSCRNLVITTEELERHPERASDPVARRVRAEADTVLTEMRAGVVVPTYQIVLPLAGAVALAALASAPWRGPAALASLARGVRQASATDEAVRVIVAPPAYTRRRTEILTNPSRIDVLEGSRIRFETPSGWKVRFGRAPVGDEVVAEESGYFAVEAPANGPETRLIPLNVDRDRAPSVRIGVPAKDLLLMNGSKSLPIELQASDDLGLASLELRYTKVSGSGEHFDFVEGTVPATVQRTSAREWRARATLELPSLRLGPGDSLIYRAVARDERPGPAGIGASDTYFIEIAGPGQVALEGVDMPPELDRYAMSQQMIVLKLERLRAKQTAINRDALVEEAASIAAEQRTVRANFIFLLGGRVEDEEEEAAQSHEIQEGRLENTARKDINSAISEMTRVEQRLNSVDVPGALPPARSAVEALQRAFGRSRYLLRSLAVTSRLDPSRRLTGDVADAEGWQRTPAQAEAREGNEARELLRMLIDAAERSRDTRHPAASELQQLAEFALRIDPGSPLWQGIGSAIARATTTAALDAVIVHVSPESRRGTVPRAGGVTPGSAIQRAFRAERRR